MKRLDHILINDMVGNIFLSFVLFHWSAMLLFDAEVSWEFFQLILIVYLMDFYIVEHADEYFL